MIRNDDVESVSDTMVINDDHSLDGPLSTMKINGSDDETDSTMKSKRNVAFFVIVKFVNYMQFSY